MCSNSKVKFSIEVDQEIITFSNLNDLEDNELKKRIIKNFSEFKMVTYSKAAKHFLNQELGITTELITFNREENKIMIKIK